MKIFTGIQSTGVPHLGNVLGSIQPAIDISNQKDNTGIFFVADLHSLTSIKDPKLIEHNTLAIAAAWLALGLDAKKNIFFRQSMVPEVCELKWYLDCFTPYPMLANAHSFKDKSSKLNDVNAGLFTYPVLMAADILLYDSDVVPVGKDQVQHLEITRDIAKSFNSRIQEVFIIPKAKIYKNEVVIGTDGQKMSKSYKNTIDVFADEKTLKKQIMSIKTDSTPLDEPKDYKNCNIFKLYDQLSDDSSKLKQSYINGTIGFGDAKKQLLELVLKKFAKAREHFNNFLNNKPELIKILEAGEVRASKIAKNKLKQVKKALYS